MNTLSGGRKKTIVNFLSLSILQIGNYVLPMITLPIISRIIGPEKYGAINYAFAFAGYFIMFINAGFDLYGSRLITSYQGDKEKISRLFSRITMAKIYLAIASTIGFVICLFTIEQLRAEIAVNVFTYLLCIGWIFNPSWLYNGLQDSRKYAVFSFVSKLLFAIAVIVVVQQRDDYIYHPLITSIAHVLVSLISFYYAMRKYNLKFYYIKSAEVFHTLKENKGLSVIWWITNQSSSTGIVIAGFLLATIDVGHYSAALRMIIIVQSIVSMPLNTVLFPYIGEAFVNGHSDGMKRVNQTLPYLVFIAFAMAAGVFLVAQPLIGIFFGSEFAEAVPLLKILAIALLFATLNSALGQQVMLNLKKDSTQIKFVVAGFVLTILLLLLMINLYGTIGAAIAWPLSEAILFIGYVVYFKTNDIKIVEYAYYNPKFLVSNMRKMFKSNPLRNKTAVQ